MERLLKEPALAMAEGAQALIDLLEKIGVDFRMGEVRGALEDILRFGSANIPDLWLSDEEMVEKGLVEAQPGWSGPVGFDYKVWMRRRSDLVQERLEGTENPNVKSRCRNGRHERDTQNHK